ncbi:hypothetical protein T440DRAFT_463787 [Plenodomus tracheiphilus IPT5]|uniref:Uncharacterized protein n=1 Tax=Plenodomus tracheiphilus IPT5 TaxID=1408161 RepID=A0A6A7BIU3_9PLEO|nr:hypothetical protein T440DRAFT_463787 [Plenodomus tracheiphilus IPT5]
MPLPFQRPSTHDGRWACVPREGNLRSARLLLDPRLDPWFTPGWSHATLVSTGQNCLAGTTNVHVAGCEPRERRRYGGRVSAKLRTNLWRF